MQQRINRNPMDKDEEVLETEKEYMEIDDSPEKLFGDPIVPKNCNCRGFWDMSWTDKLEN